MAKEDKRFQEWLEATKAKLDPSIHRAFDALAEHDSAKEVFRGYLREDEFYRNLQKVKDDEKALKSEKDALQSEIAKFERQRTEWRTWYQNEKPKVDNFASENAALKKQIEAMQAKLGRGAKDDDDTDGGAARGSREMNDELKATLDQLKQELNETKGRLEAVDGNIPAFMAGVATVIQKANKEGFEVDPNQLIDLALRNRTTPDVAYYQLTYEERTKRASEQREKDIKEAEERGRRSALADRPSPDHLRPAGPSVIDRIRGKVDYPTSRRDIVDAAVEEWRKIQHDGLGA